MRCDVSLAHQEHMSQYLTTNEYKGFSLVPDTVIDQLLQTKPDWLNNQLILCSGEIDSRLAKRYITPFVNVPNQVKIWLTKLVDLRVYLSFGTDPADRQMELIYEQEKTAKEEIKEAADCVTGLYDLPLIQDQSSSGIQKPKVLFTSNASPYSFIHQQARKARNDR